MGTPYDGDGGDGYGGMFPAEEAFSRLPSEWQEDPWVQNIYAELMGSDSWAEAKEWHDSLQDYIYDQYDEYFDDYFDWDDWRDSYEARAG
jgi:hypothetical protein